MMTQFLPPNLLALFAPREPIVYLPPLDKLSHEKKKSRILGIAQYLNEFEDPKETPPITRVETREERKERKRKEKAEQIAYKLEQEIALWDPHSNHLTTSDAFRTLFIARINYDTTEAKLRREFEVYGPIKKIVMVHNTVSGKPRGYAFIEYEHERDMHSAYKHADGRKIDGRRVLVDVERGRTVKGWLPRRLGGGLGGTRRGGPDVNIKHSGREDNMRYRDEKEDLKGRVERDESVMTGVRGRISNSSGGFRDRMRERERDRDRERRRSRSKERERKHRSRSREHRRHRSRSKEKDRRRQSRSRDRKKKDEKKDKSRLEEMDMRIKQEPQDDYGYNNYGYIKQEPMDDQQYGYSGFNAQDY